MCPDSDAKPNAVNGSSANMERLTPLASRQTFAVSLLDDDSSALKATSRLLESAGWEVKSFTNPFAFLEHAKAHQPRVAVIDIRMPLMDGLEVQRHLRTIAPATRVVILTSNDEPTVRAQALNAGASSFFLKVVDAEDFLAGIENAATSSELRIHGRPDTSGP
jgi:two-component system, LuxR family, response regulator TtrR